MSKRQMVHNCGCCRVALHRKVFRRVQPPLHAKYAASIGDRCLESSLQAAHGEPHSWATPEDVARPVGGLLGSRWYSEPVQHRHRRSTGSSRSRHHRLERCRYRLAAWCCPHCQPVFLCRGRRRIHSPHRRLQPHPHQQHGGSSGWPAGHAAARPAAGLALPCHHRHPLPGSPLPHPDAQVQEACAGACSACHDAPERVALHLGVQGSCWLHWGRCSPTYKAVAARQSLLWMPCPRCCHGTLWPQRVLHPRAPRPAALGPSRCCQVGDAVTAQLTVERCSGSRVTFQTLCLSSASGETLVEGTALALIRPGKAATAAARGSALSGRSAATGQQNGDL